MWGIGRLSVVIANFSYWKISEVGKFAEVEDVCV